MKTASRKRTTAYRSSRLRSENRDHCQSMLLVSLTSLPYSEPLSRPHPDNYNMPKSKLSPMLLAAIAVLLTPTTVLAQQAAPIAAQSDVAMGLKRDPALAATIADISAAQIRATDSALVAFGTRHTMSDTVSNSRGIGAARRYLFNKLTAYSKACGGCLRVEYDPALLEMRGHPQRPVVNVV